MRTARQRLGPTLLCLSVVPLLLAGCSKPKIQYPPRVDLARFRTLGMMDFSAPAGADLGSLASREFLASLQSAQPGTAVLELGDEKRVLAGLGRATLDLEGIRAIGGKYRVDTLIVGALHDEDVQPNVSFDSALSWITASAEVESLLNVRILDTSSGATLWSTVESARTEIVHVDLDASGVSGGSANPPDEARLRLVRLLCRRATRAFRPYWE